MRYAVLLARVSSPSGHATLEAWSSESRSDLRQWCNGNATDARPGPPCPQRNPAGPSIYAGALRPSTPIPIASSRTVYEFSISARHAMSEQRAFLLARLAVTSPTSAEVLELPLVASSLPGYEARQWYAPRNTPPKKRGLCRHCDGVALCRDERRCAAGFGCCLRRTGRRRDGAMGPGGEIRPAESRARPATQ